MTDPIDDRTIPSCTGRSASPPTTRRGSCSTLGRRVDDFTPEEIDDVLARAYASTYHWARGR